MQQGLLGDAKSFKAHFEGPITAGTDRRASQACRDAGEARARELRHRIAPCFLRREKAQILQQPAGRCFLSSHQAVAPSISNSTSHCHLQWIAAVVAS